jgi:hypothetical protein
VGVAHDNIPILLKELMAPRLLLLTRNVLRERAVALREEKN